MEIEDLLWADGQDNDAGLSEEHYYALKRDIETFPTIVANPATMSARGKLIGNFVMKPNKFFRKIYCTLEQGEIVSTQVGSRDGRSYENKATLYVPGYRSVNVGFLEALKNSKIVLIIRQLDGTMVVFGSKYIGGEIDSSELKTGKAITDGKGTTFTVRSIGRIAPIYWEPGDADKMPPLEDED